jgi:hypothetical protein
VHPEFFLKKGCAFLKATASTQTKQFHFQYSMILVPKLQYLTVYNNVVLVSVAKMPDNKRNDKSHEQVTGEQCINTEYMHWNQ